MSSIAPQSDLPDAEALVAYLDGELPPEESRRVEERLASDPEYRQQLHGLDQAWEALNALPASRANDDFARTTMELVTVAAEGEASQHAVRARRERRRQALGWIAAGLAVALCGFLAAWLLLERRDRALLADLPVIRHLNALMHVQDVEALRQLAEAVPSSELVGGEAVLKDGLEQLGPMRAERLATRREWLTARSTEEKITLAAQAERFRKLTREEQQRMRQLHEQIMSAEDRERLERQLVAYGQWLAQLRPGEQEELNEGLRKLTAAEDRVELIRNQVERDREQTSRRLPPADAVKLRAAVLTLVEARRSRLEEELRKRDPDRLQRLQRSPGGMAMAVLFWELRNDETRRQLEDQLSPEAQTRLDRLSPGARRWHLYQWIRESFRPVWDPRALEQFFTNELTNAQRERLLNMRTIEMQAHLERLYIAAQLGLGEGEAWWVDSQASARPPFEHGESSRRPPPGGFGPDERPRGPRRPRGPGERSEGPPPPADGPRAPGPREAI